MQINEFKHWSDRICNRCLLLLKASEMFRKLCQHSVKRWQDLYQLTERNLKESGDKTDEFMEILNQTTSSKDPFEKTKCEKPLVLIDEQSQEGSDENNFVFEVIEGFVEDGYEADDNILDSNEAEVCICYALPHSGTVYAIW